MRTIVARIRVGIWSGRDKSRVRKRHTGRNLSIVGLVLAIVVIAVVLSGALTPQPTFVMIVRAYDQTKGNP